MLLSDADETTAPADPTSTVAGDQQPPQKSIRQNPMNRIGINFHRVVYRFRFLVECCAKEVVAGVVTFRYPFIIRKLWRLLVLRLFSIHKRGPLLKTKMLYTT